MPHIFGSGNIPRDYSLTVGELRPYRLVVTECPTHLTDRPGAPPRLSHLKHLSPKFDGASVNHHRVSINVVDRTLILYHTHMLHTPTTKYLMINHTHV